jgi:hypothetical protein
MEKEPFYQNLVLNYIKEKGMKFVLDRNILLRGLAVGVIPTEGTFTTLEIITGGQTGKPLYIPFYNINGFVEKIFPHIKNNQVKFPLINSDGTKIIEPDGVVINLVPPSYSSENFSSSTEYRGSEQDNSLLCLSDNFIRSTADKTLYNKLLNSNQWALWPLQFFIIQLDLNGTEYMSMEYLETKVKYVNFCKIANFRFQEEKKTGVYFDYAYVNREDMIYKPIFEKFIKKFNSTNLCH